MDTVQAQIVDFDSVSVGTLPSGWIAGVTGRGAPRWAVVEDATAPSAPRGSSNPAAGRSRGVCGATWRSPTASSRRG
jgi:hypothetical protein